MAYYPFRTTTTMPISLLIPSNLNSYEEFQEYFLVLGKTERQLFCLEPNNPIFQHYIKDTSQFSDIVKNSVKNLHDIQFILKICSNIMFKKILENSSIALPNILSVIDPRHWSEILSLIFKDFIKFLSFLKLQAVKDRISLLTQYPYRTLQQSIKTPEHIMQVCYVLEINDRFWFLKFLTMPTVAQILTCNPSALMTLLLALEDGVQQDFIYLLEENEKFPEIYTALSIPEKIFLLSYYDIKQHDDLLKQFCEFFHPYSLLWKKNLSPIKNARCLLNNTDTSFNFFTTPKEDISTLTAEQELEETPVESLPLLLLLVDQSIKPGEKNLANDLYCRLLFVCGMTENFQILSKTEFRL